MRNLAFCLKRRRLPLHSPVLGNENLDETIRLRLVQLGGPKYIVSRMHDAGNPSRMLQRKIFSSGYSSVHGESPSAEYAKMKKESLESKFGVVLGSKSVSAFYRFGPFLALYRAAIISFYVLKLTIWRLFVQDLNKRAVKFREMLIHLGPFYIKIMEGVKNSTDLWQVT